MNISRYNYETYFLLYLDRELGPTDMETVDRFLKENADLQKEFTLLQQTIQFPAEITYEPKETLFRQEEKRRTIPFYWIRIAASVVLLVAGSFLVTNLVLKYRAADKAGNGGLSANTGMKKNPSNANSGIEKGNTDNRTAQVLDRVENKPKSRAIQRETELLQKGQVVDGVKKQSPEALSKKQEVHSPESNPEQVETEIARQKPTDAIPLQTTAMQTGNVPEQIALKPATSATALVLTGSGKEGKDNRELAVLNDAEFQTDNAISVVALNEKNKNITGFFKKLTRRNPADEETKKLRVSVFQISL